jgi:hypothetical protein
MKKYTLFIMLSLAMIGFAQEAKKTKPVVLDEDTRINPRDIKDNDPSTAEALKLPKLIMQDAYKNRIWEVDYSFRNYYANILNLSSRKQEKYYPLFKIHQDRYTPKSENGLTLVNNGAEYEGISDKKRGFCWGYSTLVRNFNVLAFYDPTNLDLVPNKSTHYQDWVVFYTKRIDLIAKNKVAVFPGISNLRELSNDPKIELYLKITAMKIWRRLASKPNSLIDYLKTTNAMKPAQIIKVIQELQTRLSIGESPKILFSSWRTEKGDKAGRALGTSKFIHAVNVYNITSTNEGYKIWIWDINFYAETLMREPKFVEVSRDGSRIYYQAWEEPNRTDAKSETGSNINRLYIPAENDRETMTHLEELYRFCHSPKTAHYCSGVPQKNITLS